MFTISYRMSSGSGRRDGLTAKAAAEAYDELLAAGAGEIAIRNERGEVVARESLPAPVAWTLRLAVR